MTVHWEQTHSVYLLLLSVYSHVAFIAGAMWVTVCINRSKPMKEQQVAPPYDEVDIQSQKPVIKVKENVAYEDTQGQMIKVEENMAYEPVKID